MKMRDRQAIRDADAGDSLEILLITAIGTMLGLRVYLQLAHYPQVGGGSLHISHVLWGGLAMMAALVLLLAYWNPAVRRSAAVLAGIGWGAFIDELGKFITKDYDYLFRPTFAVLYLLFMAMYVAFWSLTQRHALSAREREVNRELRVRLRTAADGRDLGGVIGRLVLGARRRIDAGYARLSVQPWFERGLIGLFLAVGLTDIGRTLRHLFTRGARGQDYSPYEIAATLAANACVWVGIACLRRSRLRAMHWFQRSLVVVMLLTTPLHFYHRQLEAFGGFLWTLVLYLMVRYAIRREASTV